MDTQNLVLVLFGCWMDVFLRCFSFMLSGFFDFFTIHTWYFLLLTAMELLIVVWYY